MSEQSTQETVAVTETESSNEGGSTETTVVTKTTAAQKELEQLNDSATKSTKSVTKSVSSDAAETQSGEEKKGEMPKPQDPSSDPKTTKRKLPELSDSDSNNAAGGTGSESDQQKAHIPITATDDKDLALYSHNIIRKLHGAKELEWDQNLSDEAKTWAIHLAESDEGLHHKTPVIDFGENLYISKGTSAPARAYQAVLLWYKNISQYNFRCPGYSSHTATVTQMLWDETTHVGVGVAFREDTNTTYIVARYSPPGNDRYSESYTEHVKPPLRGLPPKIPKVEDLIAPASDDSLSNMGNLFDVLCHWCISNGDKPVENYSGVQPVKSNNQPGSKAATIGLD